MKFPTFKKQKNEQKASALQGNGPFKFSISTNDKVALISNLGTMLGAGIPILETIDSLLEDAKGNQKKLLEVMRADLMQGQQLHATFAKFPNVFDKVTVNLINASEEAGTLDVTLIDLQDNIKRDTEFSDKVKSALIYPIFILGVFVATILMILVVVIPKISTVFSRLKTPLPLPTKILIFMSNVLLNNTIPVLLTIVAIVVGLVIFVKRDKKLIKRVLFSMPVISKLALEIDLTRFSRSLYLLLSAGLPITSALDLAQEVVVRKDVSTALQRTKDTVVAGKKFSEGLKETKGIIPPIIMKIIEAGERSGSLDKSMKQAAEYLDYQVTKSLKAVTALIEPIMIVFIGILIGGMMLAIIAPIYGLIGSIGPH